MTKPIYIQNKYNIWYHNIIATAQSQDRVKGNEIYYESHHIIPKSFGGSNQKENLVLLSAREHFICHALLVKFTTGQYKHKMVFAFNLICIMKENSKKYINSKLYEVNRIRFSKIMSEREVSEETKEKMRGKNNYMYNKSHSLETKEKISKSKKGNGLGVKRTDAFKLNLSIKLSGKNHYKFKGDYHTPWGIFPSAILASNEIDNLVTDVSIRKWCKNPNIKIKKSMIAHSPYLQQLPESPLGKTFRELGFGFINQKV